MSTKETLVFPLLPTVHNEPMHEISPFLHHNSTLDVFKRSGLEGAAKSESAGEVQLSYLRVEFVRLRAGMADYLIRLATPRYADTAVKKNNTVVTLRANRSHGSLMGAKKVAKVISSEMVKREDETHAWSGIDADHLAQMLLVYLKFFTVNSSLERMQFTTEALL